MAKITNTNTNNWRKWNSTKNVLQIAGNGTPNFPLDDIYKITGGARGSNSGGHTWASLITEPLIKKFTCRWIVKGTVRLIRDGRKPYWIMEMAIAITWPLFILMELDIHITL